MREIKNYKTERFRRVYEMLDRVSPLPYDCGEGCGAACCRNEYFDDDTEPYIYLLPGEKEYLDEAGAGLKTGRELTKDHDLPASYGKYVQVAYCAGPDSCDRRFRPVQCRTFPLTPHYTEDGELRLIFYDGELPYVCPLIRERVELSEDFKEAVAEAWRILAEDPAVRDLILMDSKKRWSKPVG